MRKSNPSKCASGIFPNRIFSLYSGTPALQRSGGTPEFDRRKPDWSNPKFSSSEKLSFTDISGQDTKSEPCSKGGYPNTSSPNPHPRIPHPHNTRFFENYPPQQEVTKIHPLKTRVKIPKPPFSPKYKKTAYGEKPGKRGYPGKLYFMDFPKNTKNREIRKNGKIPLFIKTPFFKKPVFSYI